MAPYPLLLMTFFPPKILGVTADNALNNDKMIKHLAMFVDTFPSYTVQGLGQARSRPFLLALTLDPGRLDPGPGGSGQGWVRADPGPLIFSSGLNFFFFFFSNAVI